MRQRWVIPVILFVLVVWTPTGFSLVHAQGPRDIGVAPTVAPNSVPISGEYWALIIGIDRYQQAPDLTTAVHDATAVREVLIDRYGFSRERIIELLNDQATRTGIEDALYQLGQQAGLDDSVFIYYAGHGQYDDTGQLGWWVPTEANPKRPGTFIMDVSVLKYIKGMQAKHVYLVADSCFSGTLFGTRALPPINDQWYAKLYAKTSRWGFTSGGTEPVADLGKGGHSIFAYYFLAMLRENTDPYLVPSRIHDGVAPLVANNAQQMPRSEPLRGAGDDGGQFVFRLAVPAGVGVSPSPTAQGSGAGLSKEMAQVLQELQALRERIGQSEAYEKAQQEETLRQEAAARQQAEEQARLEADRKEADRRRVEQERLAEEQHQRAEAAQQQQLAEAQARKEEATRRAEEQRQQEEVVVAGVPPFSAPQRMEREIITGKDGAPMVLVPTGRFTMGNNDGYIDEQPQHEVELDAFHIDKYEVTTSRYANFIQSTGRKKPKWWPNTLLVSQEGDRPVVGVTWDDAQAYCQHYDKRLPTEAEWEKTARGSDGRIYPWGKAEPNPNLANFSRYALSWETDLYSERLTPVGHYESGKSPYGAYDMAGNVREWVGDWYDETYYQNSPTKNPKGPGEGTFHVLRGGSWGNRAVSLRSSDRGGYLPWLRFSYFGFRCARTAP